VRHRRLTFCRLLNFDVGKDDERYIRLGGTRNLLSVEGKLFLGCWRLYSLFITYRSIDNQEIRNDAARVQYGKRRDRFGFRAARRLACGDRAYQKGSIVRGHQEIVRSTRCAAIGDLTPRRVGVNSPRREI
jgi:hypothetical protein